MPKKIFKIIVYVFASIGFVLTAGYFAVKFGLTNAPGIIDSQRQSFLANAGSVGDTSANTEQNRQYGWNNSPEWQTLAAAIRKDEGLINRAAATAGIPARLLVSQLVVEQLRFFYDDRESFKKFFEPLKILGSQSKFSWGVMGIKEATAVQIEKHLKDPSSPYYLGPEYEHLLDFQTNNIAEERFTRMTDQHDHYWSYLYAGLYLKQIETQWRRAGFDISDRPEILSTLYNIGFTYSVPKANPSSGGAPIPVGGTTYSFGALAAEFYNSSELLDDFPR